ncbi:glycosyltransferase [bacterium]|nr:glycosyltransferase [bacterium]
MTLKRPSPDSPLVSIVLPTHNGARYLQQSIDSCLGQTWGDIELILVDDGSTDTETVRIVDSQADPRVRIVRVEKNAGLPDALNAGFERAKGDLLTWTSDDNLFRPEAVGRMVAFLREENVDFVYASAAVIDEEGRVIGAMLPRSPEFLMIDNCIGACFLYTRRVYEKVGRFDPETRLAEDYDYWVRASKHFRMVFLNEDLYLYRRHPGALTSVHGQRRLDEMIEKVRRRHFSRAAILRAEGLRAFHRGEKGEARALLAGAMTRRPWWLGLLRPLAICVLPDWVVGVIVRWRRRIRR